MVLIVTKCRVLRDAAVIVGLSFILASITFFALPLLADGMHSPFTPAQLDMIAAKERELHSKRPDPTTLVAMVAPGAYAGLDGSTIIYQQGTSTAAVHDYAPLVPSQFGP